MTLPGAGTGVLFFLTPQWDKLIELDVRIQIKYLSIIQFKLQNEEKVPDPA